MWIIMIIIIIIVCILSFLIFPVPKISLFDSWYINTRSFDSPLYPNTQLCVCYKDENKSDFTFKYDNTYLYAQQVAEFKACRINFIF